MNSDSQASASLSSPVKVWNPVRSILMSCANLAYSLGTFVIGDQNQTPLRRSLILTNKSKFEEPHLLPPDNDEVTERVDHLSKMVEGTTQFKGKKEGAGITTCGVNPSYMPHKELETPRRSHLGEGDTNPEATQDGDNDEIYYNSV